MTTYSIVLSGPLGTFQIKSKTQSMQLSKSLGDSSATLDLDCINLTNVHIMDSITLTIDGNVRFAGVVKNQSDTLTGTTKTSSLTCVDNTDKLQRFLIATTYTSQTAKQIIQNVFSTYASWVNTSLVKDIGGTISSINFDYDNLSAVVDKLADISGAYWYLDSNNYLHFFADNDGAASINYNSTSNMLAESVNIDYEAQELANRVYVIGARDASPTTIDNFFTGDGNNQIWVTSNTVNSPTVTENGVSKTISADTGGTPSTDYVYNKQDRTLKRVAGAASAGVVIKITYKPTVQIIDYFEDAPSVKKYGVYATALRDQKIKTKDAARKRGREYLKTSATVTKRLTWDSRDWTVEPGQQTTITVSSLGITSRKYRIESVNVNFRPDDIQAQITAVEVLQ